MSKSASLYSTPPDFGSQLLEHTIKNRIGRAIRDLQVKLIEHQGLILRGHARSYYDKQTAQEIVMELTDIPILSNDIQVS